MPHALFATAIGTCGLAWNDTGLTGFQLPEETDALTERQLAARNDTAAAATPPDWARAVMARVQQHLVGTLQDFSDVAVDWSRVSEFQRGVYREALAIKPG